MASLSSICHIPVEEENEKVINENIELTYSVNTITDCIIQI